jgi:hypothetical protein
MKNHKPQEFYLIKNCKNCPGADWEYYYCNIANHKKENPEYGLVMINPSNIPENCPLRRTRIILMLTDYLESIKGK